MRASLLFVLMDLVGTTCAVILSKLRLVNNQARDASSDTANHQVCIAKSGCKRENNAPLALAQLVTAH